MPNPDFVVLVYPRCPGETQTPDRPPLGLLTIAASLVEKGVDVLLLDERAEADFEDLLTEALARDPICVGVSSMSGRHIAGALHVSKRVKEQSQTPVVWGGVHASLAPETTARHELVDIVVRDDGEETFARLLDCLRSSDPELSRVRGIAFKANGRVVMTEPAEPVDIEKLPLIPFHIVDLGKYESREGWTSGATILPMETSRGCPFSCSFCTESVRKKKWRALPPERVVGDIQQYVQKYGVTDFTFVDDNLFGNVRRGEQIVAGLVREQAGIQWYTNIRADYMSRAGQDFLKTLEESGCRMLTFGAESGSPRILEMINKRATREQVIAANRKLAKTRIRPHFVTIRGFPTETIEDAKATFLLNAQLLLDNKNAICDSPFLIPTPGTVIAEQCLGERDAPTELEGWIDAFDLEKGGRPPWVSEDVFEFLKRNAHVVGAISRTNRHETPWWHNSRLRLYLRYLWIALRIGLR